MSTLAVQFYVVGLFSLFVIFEALECASFKGFEEGPEAFEDLAELGKQPTLSLLKS